MGHVPHLWLPAPWEGEVLALESSQVAHLERVLRRKDGDEVSYTDGEGTVGSGTLAGRAVLRGEEIRVPQPHPRLTLAVAVPASRDRVRFLVEKLGELGVARIVWLSTQRGSDRPPRTDRAISWLVGALEQSRGAWMTEVEGSLASIGDLPAPLWFADQGGAGLPEIPDSVTVAVGPEGGWAPEEVPAGSTRIALSARTLRVETAAIVAAAQILA